MAALTRMAGRSLSYYIRQGDTVIISASAIPNERFIGETINQLYKKGQKLYMKTYPVFMYQSCQSGRIKIEC